MSFGQCSHVQMDHRCSYRRHRGREYLPGSHNSNTYPVLGMGIKGLISLDFWQESTCASVSACKIRCRRPNDVFMERSRREMAHRRPADPYQQWRFRSVGNGNGHFYPACWLPALQWQALLSAVDSWRAFSLVHTGVTPLVLCQDLFQKVRNWAVPKKDEQRDGYRHAENLSNDSSPPPPEPPTTGNRNYMKHRSCSNWGGTNPNFPLLRKGHGIYIWRGYLCAFLWGIFQLHNHEINMEQWQPFFNCGRTGTGTFLG